MNDAGDQREVDEHLDETAPVEEDAAQQHRPSRRRVRGRVDVGEEAGELDEQRERDEHADERDPVSSRPL